MDELIGQHVAGRYEVMSRLGQGGMGAVYAAKQAPLGRTVAMKVLLRDLTADPVASARFEKEALAISRLAHPNIVTIFDFGTTETGLKFIVMEHLDGRSLRDVISREAPLSPRRTVRLVMYIARALAEAHKQGVVHRDLKPDNIMVLHATGEPDFLKVLDFGVAKLKRNEGEASHTVTSADVILGTPKYMSPEQVNGVTDDPRSDLYAVGALAYEMLTGRVPFEGDGPVKILMAHLTQAPEPLKVRNPACKASEMLEDLVMQLLEKDPERRPQSAQKLLEMLEDLPEYTGPRSKLTTQAAFQAVRIPIPEEPRPARAERPAAEAVNPTISQQATLVRSATDPELQSFEEDAATSADGSSLAATQAVDGVFAAAPPTVAGSRSAIPLKAPSTAAAPRVSSDRAARASLPAPVSASAPTPAADMPARASAEAPAPVTPRPRAAAVSTHVTRLAGGPSMLAWGAGAMAAVLVVGGVALWGARALRQRTAVAPVTVSAPPAPVPTPAPVTPPPAEVPAPVPAPAPAAPAPPHDDDPATAEPPDEAPAVTPPAEAPVRTEPRAPVRVVTVTVTSTPPGAEVLEAGTLLGTTPATLSFPRGGPAHALTVKLDGYRDETRPVKPDRNRSVLFKLEKERPRPAEPRREVKTPEPVRKPEGRKGEPSKPPEPRFEKWDDLKDPSFGN
ncbi:MAG: protein kinase [Deltaproteobacteria bacterium]|nr:protein kinase [Deltaproteobacteria bacterium]